MTRILFVEIMAVLLRGVVSGLLGRAGGVVNTSAETQAVLRGVRGARTGATGADTGVSGAIGIAAVMMIPRTALAEDVEAEAAAGGLEEVRPEQRHLSHSANK